jgi:hypothetical protein
MEVGPQIGTKVTKANQVVPTRLTRSMSIRANLRTWVSFWDAFGIFGPVLVTIVLISILWTTWLIVLTIVPNETANYLMNTTEYDKGQFWLIVDPEYYVKALSVAGLATVDACYVFILFKLVSWRHRNLKRTSQAVEEEQKTKLTWIRIGATFFTRVKSAWRELGGLRGRYRKFWVGL